MDFDIGNILYIVITLVAVLIGVLGKKRKPKGTGQEKSAPGSSFMENLEKAFNMGQEDRVVADLEEYEEDVPIEESDYETVTSEATTMAGPGMLNEYEQYLDRSGVVDQDLILSGGDMDTEPLEIVHLDDESGTNYFDVIKDFNAGTAVVYSAIINRLDY